MDNLLTKFFRCLPARVFAAAVASSVAFAQQAPVSGLTPPPVPVNLQVPAGNIVFLKGQAQGTQSYVCLSSPSGVSWTLFSPQATLFFNFEWIGRQNRQQIITHFLSPNPNEGGTPRVTWQSTLDTSAVWAKPVQGSGDPDYVAADAVPWLLLQRVGSQRGPTGGEILAKTTYIQRLSTSGGVAPLTGCSQPENLGSTALVPYTADYFFFKKRPGH